MATQPIAPRAEATSLKSIWIAPDTALAAINRALAAHDLAPSAFGRGAVRDPRLVSDLRSGRKISSRRFSRVKAFIAKLGEV